jgi:iron complex outermembrane receptor protein
MKQKFNYYFQKAKLLVALVLMAFSVQTNAQELFKLSGKVTDGTTPLPGASILIK